MNWIIAIGYMSDFVCYLNISEEEAHLRYEREQGEKAANVRRIDFTDSFGAYDVWAQEID